MTTYLLGVIACLGLLAGCGGLQGSFQPVDSYGSGAPAEREELVGEEVSTKHLEELYAKSGLSGRDPSLEAELKQWEHQAKFDVPIQMNRQVKAYLVYFSTERKAVVQRQLARSTQYLPMIKTIFQEYGLPEDLAYLAMVESGFNPNAQSPAGACGMWQFIKGTGLRYGLVINGYVDERRDPEKSTRAAAKYLQDLYRQFGSWYLAAASYNCGERRVQQELNRSNHQNFWELSANRCLPGETKNYVPQIIAATIIAKNPERFGFKNIPYQPPLPNTQMAARAGENAPGGMGLHEATLSPLPYSLPPSRQAAAGARQPNPNSKNQMEPAPKTAGRATYARSHKSATTGKPAPQVASIFGAPAAPNKNLARKDQANKKQATANHKGKKATRVANGKNQKPNPSLFAKKGNGSHAKAKIAKKSSPAGANTRKVAKTKPKSLLMSEAR